MECEITKDGLVLVGFGKHKLKDMLKWIDTDQEQDLLTSFKKWPPVYRELRACDAEDVEVACDFLAYLRSVIEEYDKHIKENTDGD
jgi:hypothetical protein